MTGRERVEAALRREPTDKTPIFLRDLTLGLDVCDYTTPEVCGGGYNSEKAARAVIETQRLLGHDCVVGAIHDLGMDIDVLGGEVAFPERGIPYISRPAFPTREALDHAILPDIHVSGRMPGVIRSYRIVADTLGAETAVAANVEGPVTKAGVLRGLDLLIKDMIRSPEAAGKIVDFAVELGCRHIDALLDAGAHFIFIAAASDGPAAIRPAQYLDYTIPGLARLVSAAKRRGAAVVFHPHGPFTREQFWPLVDAAIATGITGFQFGEDNDLGLAMKRWGNQICILGGPDIPTVLVPGPPERIAEDTRDIIAAVGTKGFILMPSCSVHRGFPLTHLQAMIETAHA